MARKNKIAVIGSGLGGLSAAARLAAKGFDVDVFEKSAVSGGKAGEVSVGGYRFDTGPSVLTMKFVLEDLFSEIGEKLEDYLAVEQMDIHCRYFFPDGTVIDAYSGFERLASEIYKKTGTGWQELKKYFDYCGRIYDLTKDIFLMRSLMELRTYANFDAFRTLIKIKNIDSFRTMHEANSEYFSDKRIIQLFDRYATYNGSSPYKAPATLNIIPHVEFTMGSYYVREGIRSIPLSIEKAAAKKGAKFYFNTQVDKIVCRKNKVTGIIACGKEYNYDAVITNCDVNYTYKNLLEGGGSFFSEKYKNLEPSSSALVFLWGIRGMNPSLEAHNILFSENYRKEFEQLFNFMQCPDDPTVYIHISSKYKYDDAPSGNENWFVMINAPAAGTVTDWKKEALRMKEVIQKKIKEMLKIDLSSLIAYEKIITPEDIERNTGSFRGSIYGISSNSRFAAFLRQSNRSRRYRGLFFAGGSAHPGGGIPLVLLSGKIVSRMIGEML